VPARHEHRAPSPPHAIRNPASFASFVPQTSTKFTKMIGCIFLCLFVFLCLFAIPLCG
jgi:hypothetical protein